MGGDIRIRATDLSRLLGPWAGRTASLSQSLAAALLHLIDSGLLAPGTRLPAQRSLAAALGIARGTVAAAYESLEASGHLSSRQGSGSWVRSGHGGGRTRTSGRLFSFTSEPGVGLDLSSGALPASSFVKAALTRLSTSDVDAYLPTDGYFPAGLPALRADVAARRTLDGVAANARQVMITAGAQQATWLAAHDLVAPGDLVMVEEPTYRGALECLASAGAQLRGVRMVDGGIDVAHLRQITKRGARVLYCQTGIHNPTGQTMSAAARRELAAEINRSGLLTIEDTSSCDLTLSGAPVAPTLSGLVDPDLLISVGTLSKVFWGGLRVGWIISSAAHVERLTEQRKAIGLATSVVDQLLATALLRDIEAARSERRDFLRHALITTETLLRRIRPQWTWERPAGGAGLWIDTHGDAVRLAERAKAHGVKLAPGPGFSVYDGLRTFLRLPVWHEFDLLERGLRMTGDSAGGA